MPHDVYTPELTPDLLAKIREYADNDLPIGSTTAKEWLRAQQAEIERHNRLLETMKESVSAVISESRKDIEKLQLMLNAVTAEAREHLVALQQSRKENKRLLTALSGAAVIADVSGEEIRRLKAERDDYRAELEWYGGGSEDGGEKARDILLRYKRGDNTDGEPTSA